MSVVQGVSSRSVCCAWSAVFCAVVHRVSVVQVSPFFRACPPCVRVALSVASLSTYAAHYSRDICVYGCASVSVFTYTWGLTRGDSSTASNPWAPYGAGADYESGRGRLMKLWAKVAHPHTHAHLFQ